MIRVTSLHSNIISVNTKHITPNNELNEDRHPHTYHARQDAQLGTKIRIWRIHTFRTS